MTNNSAGALEKIEISALTHLDMLAVNAFEERNDGILVEQQPKTEPKHE